MSTRSVTAEQLRRIADRMDSLQHNVGGVLAADLDYGDGVTVRVWRSTFESDLTVSVAG